MVTQSEILDVEKTRWARWACSSLVVERQKPENSFDTLNSSMNDASVYRRLVRPKDL